MQLRALRSGGGITERELMQFRLLRTSPLSSYVDRPTAPLPLHTSPSAAMCLPSNQGDLPITTDSRSRANAGARLGNQGPPLFPVRLERRLLILDDSAETRRTSRWRQGQGGVPRTARDGTTDRGGEDRHADGFILTGRGRARRKVVVQRTHLDTQFASLQELRMFFVHLWLGLYG